MCLERATMFPTTTCRKERLSWVSLFATSVGGFDYLLEHPRTQPWKAVYFARNGSLITTSLMRSRRPSPFAADSVVIASMWGRSLGEV